MNFTWDLWKASSITLLPVSIAATCYTSITVTLISSSQFTCDLNSYYSIFNDLKANLSKPESLNSLLLTLMSFIYNLRKASTPTAYSVNHGCLEVFHVLIIQFVLPHIIPLSYNNLTFQFYFYSSLYLFFTSLRNDYIFTTVILKNDFYLLHLT